MILLFALLRVFHLVQSVWIICAEKQITLVQHLLNISLLRVVVAVAHLVSLVQAAVALVDTELERQVLLDQEPHTRLQSVVVVLALLLFRLQVQASMEVLVAALRLAA
jgi:hypothetical protein